jgi:hypothetical protein
MMDRTGYDDRSAREVARRVVIVHQTTGWCLQCTGSLCPAAAWARAYVTERRVTTTEADR